MSAAGGISESGGRSMPFAKWTLPLFRELVMPFSQKLLANNSGGSPLRGAAEGQIAGSLSDASLLPEANPTLAAQDAAIRRSGAEQLDHQIARNNGAAQANGTLLSTKTGLNNNQLVRANAQEVGSAQAQLYGDNYAQARAAQIAAVPGAYNAADLDMTELMSFLEILKGQSSKNKSFDMNAKGGMGG